MKISCLTISAAKLILVSALFVSCTQKTKEIVTLSGNTMGTTYSVRYVDEQDKVKPEEMQKLIDKRLEEVNDSMSTYHPESELSKLNKTDANVWVTLSADLNLVMKTAWKISAMSSGKYDVSVGPAVNLWGFGPSGPRRIPEEAEIQNALKVIGIDKFQYESESSRILKKIKESYIDLSSIAKGFGVDQVGGVLESQKIMNYVVEIGGEIVTRGTKNGEKWKIAVQSPIEGNHDFARVIAVDNIAMATSGNYRNFFKEDGKKFSHTLDPKTGRPYQHSLASVTILSNENCMVADGIATAMMASGPDALALANKEKIMALFIYVEDGKLRQVESDEFTKFMAGKI